MNTIRLAGQVITCVNYTTNRIFNFNPDPVRRAAEDFLASGITEIEIPQNVLDPEKRFNGERPDAETVERTVAGLPRECSVIGSYLSPGPLGEDNAAYLNDARRTLDGLLEFFPDLMQTMVHPARSKELNASGVRDVVRTWAELARYAAEQRPGFQCCMHNHYDSSCETADQVRIYLDAVAEEDEPALRWGPDTGHCHGMGEAYLEVFEEYAPLIGNYFHIKARIAAFDKLHGGEAYRTDRDMWGNTAEFGRGLYGGFVNCADPEMETPLKEVFAIIREKARPAQGVVTGAMEIDYPRQHPRLEAMCAAFYLKQAHGIEPGLSLRCEDIVRRVFQ